MGERATIHHNLQRALATYDAMQTHFSRGARSVLYRERYPSAPTDPPYAYEWPFSQAHAATLDMLPLQEAAGRRFDADLRERARGQEHYWKRSGATGLPGYASTVRRLFAASGALYYDDNAWVGFELMRQHALTQRRDALERARQLFALIVSGWDDDPRHPAPGGVFWTQDPANADRNTVSNMPGAELGLRLAAVNGDEAAVRWARRMIEWTDATLLAPNGLYWDHIDLSGTIEKTQWSYNQGVPVAVYARLSRLTGDAAHLQHAQVLATTALDFFAEADRLLRQPPAFNAIFFKRLLFLESLDSVPRARQLMRRYADYAWETLRDPATGLFCLDASGRASLLDTAALTQLFAVLAWPGRDARLL